MLEYDYGHHEKWFHPRREESRFENGSLFQPLFPAGSSVTTSAPEPTFSVRRTCEFVAADRRAAEIAGLEHLLGEVWTSQELVLATVLEPILPSILVWGFEFWLAAQSCSLGYRRTEHKLSASSRAGDSN